MNLMRLMRCAGLLIAIVLFMASFAVAGANQFGVADSYRVNFAEPVRIADTLLPQGDYEIRHTMQGQDHIMVFRQLGTRKVVEVKAKCTLVPLLGKAANSEKIYSVNAANERVLHELTFKGDTAKHVF
jgi:hypothetical protein